MLQVQKDLDNYGLFTALENLKLNPIPIVRRIDLLDESISAGFRDNSFTTNEKAILEEVFKDMARQELRYLIGQFPADLARSLAQLFTPQEKQQAADSMARSMLRQMAFNLDNAVLREKYSDPSLTERQLLEVLKYVDGEQRLSFLKALCDSCQANLELRAFIIGKFDNALHFAGTNERVFLIDHLLAGQTPCAFADIAAILRCSKDFDQLHGVITAAGAERLLAAADGASADDKQALRELVALSEITGKLRGAFLPVCLEAGAQPKDIEEALQGLERALNERQAIVAAFSGLSDTRISKDYQDTLDYERGYLASQRTAAASDEELIKLVNLMIQKLELEFQYGIKLTHEEPGPVISTANGGLTVEISAGAHWTSQQLRDVRDALQRLPEGILLVTPLLKEIQRVENLGEYVLGQRRQGGQIQIADFAINNPILERINPGVPSIAQTLIHELGHGLQLGEGSAHIIKTPDNEYLLAPGDVRYEFAEFMRISGWALIHPDRFEITNCGLSVKLDGEEYILGVPVQHRGETLVLALNQGLLFSYRALAPFSLVKYSRTNPWEDWAEAFCEYILFPERLITFAPQKFQYLEEEFRCHEERADLQERLQDELAKEKHKAAVKENSR